MKRRTFIKIGLGTTALAAVPFQACRGDRKSTRLNSSHSQISYAVFCLKKKKTLIHGLPRVNLISTLLESIPLWSDLKQLHTSEALISIALEYYYWTATILRPDICLRV